MRRKVVNIKSANLPKDKPFLSMSKREMEDTFLDMGGPLEEGVLAEARATRQTASLISVVLTTKDKSERLVVSYEEYGDRNNVSTCEDIIGELSSFLHEGESLRIATYDVDIGLAEPFKFPKLTASDSESRRCYEWLHEARGMTTIIVTWLVTGTDRRIYSWDIDHGDGAAMEENVTQTVRTVKYNKLLARNERLEVIAYKLPMSALHERRSEY